MNKRFLKKLYPELAKAGGLNNGLSNAFDQIKSSLRPSRDKEITKIPLTFSVIEKDNKFSQVYIASEEKCYLPDFWKNGVCMANGNTSNIVDLARAIDTWLNEDLTTEQFSSKFDFITPNKKATVFDKGEEVAYTWNQLLNDDSMPELKEFIALALKDSTLCQLFPFTSLYTLCFSRCTGYPFDTSDLPNLTPKQHAWMLPKNDINQETNSSEQTIYVVTKNKRDYIGEGDAKQALKIVIDNLPENIKPAVKGTLRN